MYAALERYIKLITQRMEGVGTKDRRHRYGSKEGEERKNRNDCSPVVTTRHR
jgi:hypothetical protein